VLAWNGEAVQVVEQGESRTRIRSVSGRGEREVSPGTPVLAGEEWTAPAHEPIDDGYSVERLQAELRRSDKTHLVRIIGPEHTEQALELMAEADRCRLITYREFRDLMAKRRRTVDDLVDLFRGKIEEPREYFERVLSCRYHGEDRSGVVIPYKSVIQFYRSELEYWTASQAEEAERASKRKLDLTPDQRAARRQQMEKLNRSRSAKSSTVEN